MLAMGNGRLNTGYRGRLFRGESGYNLIFYIPISDSRRAVHVAPIGEERVKSNAGLIRSISQSSIMS